MNNNIIGAVVVGIIGLFIAFVNYIISKNVLIKSAEKYSLVTVVRQIVQVSFLAVVYFAGTKAQDINPVYLLVGAAIGMTLPMMYFTKKLLSINETLTARITEKGDEADG